MFADEEGQRKRATVLSVVAGLLCGLGWWMYIDATARGSDKDNSHTDDTAGYSWICGTLVTIFFVMLNGFKWSELDPDSDGHVKARLFLLFTILVGLSGVVGALFIMLKEYTDRNPEPPEGTWPGVAIMIQCLIIFVAAFIMRAGTMQSSPV
mmetsp:Transcript_14125/g.45183  ORF Transcript_14125/g.45183 Transcript_14125/m.45183 type:complete len:152 (+) Transcript_14125:195-650(+)|eukprot:CAMPEP_0196768894 /NCGR_PEP_ID=MMETSP1104-20130614/195_1 /TAXON_ID=33652 /ORGANISM="Cafeteria sp., Strain Caron Lab Isolate" /LENGTH=151 /DNA_ID=CAMNT_0042138971 /DNA_START=192 /DNA_END=647 /DNA_ORIENTATION=-